MRLLCTPWVYFLGLLAETHTGVPYIFSENGVVTGNKDLDISEDIQISSVMGGTRVAQWCKRRHVLKMDWIRFPVTTNHVMK